MIACFSRRKVEIVASIKFVDSVLNVGRRMSLNNIHDHE